MFYPGNACLVLYPKINVIHHIDTIKEKKHMIILINAANVFEILNIH